VPDTVHAREPVRLSAHLSEDPDGNIVDYVWDYGLGVVHGRQVDVLFTGTGTRNVTLEVVDDLDARTIRTFQVEVLAAKEPLRPPAEEVPDDRGEVPGPGSTAAFLAMLMAVLVASFSGRRDRENPGAGACQSHVRTTRQRI
jgi:hypothetical protein